MLLVVRGAGLALAQMPAMTAAYTSVTRAQMGDATTIVNVVQRTGGALGPSRWWCCLPRRSGQAKVALGAVAMVRPSCCWFCSRLPRSVQRQRYGPGGWRPESMTSRAECDKAPRRAPTLAA
ncbi:hypothetical protein A8U91_02931 [Halomonas elongata]|uniref:Uncharacterized protein n=1 Tax=Halomonas elongata TaxID=2746 RepID=A0A1B8NV97_HALEL|nr:hypothetical protein [Halomonas elongata]OBX33888.1 hypothetical protein A8U91_02931 [Halomonas elongata]